MDLSNDSFLNNLLEQNKQKIFFNKCLNEGVKKETIESLISNLKKYKNLMKTNKINLNEVIVDNTKTALKRFEDINDRVEKTILENKGKKLLSSVTSKKHSSLINEETKEIFQTLAMNGVTRDQLESSVTFKLEAFEDSHSFNEVLKKTLLTRESKESLINRVKSTTAEIISTKNNKIVLLINSASDMKELGTDMWCVSRDDDMYDHYIRNNDRFTVTYDYSKSHLNNASLSAAIVSPSGKVLELYNNKDKLFNDVEIKKEIENSINKISYKELKEKIKKDNKNNGKEYVKNEIFKMSLLSGYLKEFESDSIKFKASSFNKLEILSKEIIENDGFSYVDKIKDLDKEDQENFIFRYIEGGFHRKYIEDNSVEILSKLLKSNLYNDLLEKELTRAFTGRKGYYHKYATIISTMNEYDQLTSFDKKEIEFVNNVAKKVINTEDRFKYLLEVTAEDSIKIEKDLDFMIEEDCDTFKKVLNSIDMFEDVDLLINNSFQYKGEAFTKEKILNNLTTENKDNVLNNIKSNILKNTLKSNITSTTLIQNLKKNNLLNNYIDKKEKPEVLDVNADSALIMLLLENNESENIKKYKEMIKEVNVVETTNHSYLNDIYKTFSFFLTKVNKENEKNLLNNLKEIIKELPEKKKENWLYAIEVISPKTKEKLDNNLKSSSVRLKI